MKRLVIVGLALMAGCSSRPSDGGVLVWARSADSATLDPAEVEWGEDIKVVHNLYETLVSFNAGLELEGRLAVSWTFSADHKTLTFNLRPGVTFHDGTPFDAEAVVFTIRRLLDPAHPQKPRVVPYARHFADIEKVEATGPLAVVATLKRPNRILLFSLALPAASIVSPAAVRRHGDQFAKHPAGTGPYRLARWERDVKIDLEAFPGYWGAKPPIPRVIVVPVAAPQTAIEKLRHGEVHVVDHVAFADAARGDAAFTPARGLELGVCCLGFNMRKFPYSDVHFRRAVALALDRRVLVDLAFHGMAVPAAGVVPPALGGEPPPSGGPDLEAARRELAQVKLESNRVDLIHVAISRPYMPEPQRVAEFVKDQLRKIGLEVKLTAYDKGAYGQKSKEEAHPMILIGWKGDYPDPDGYLYPFLHGDNAGDLNQSFFDDPAFNEAVRAAQEEFDAAKRQALYARASARYRDLMPTIPLAHVPQVLAVSGMIHYTPHPLEYRFFAARWRD